MNKRFILCAYLALSSLVLQAQTTIDNLDDLRTVLDTVFADLEVNRIPYGYLSDYSHLPMNTTHLHLSAQDSVVAADMEDFEIVRSWLQSCKISSSGVPDYLNVSGMKEASSSSHVKLGMICFSYSQFKDNAFTDGLISSSGGKLYDVYQNGSWVNPYQIEKVFVGVPMHSTCDLSVTFEFSAIQCLRNQPVSYFTFDAGDGVGPREFSYFSDYSFSVQYPSAGEKRITMTAHFSDNTELKCYSRITVVSLDVEPQEAASDTSYPVIYGQNRATCHRRLLPGHSSPLKPFIIVEGLDVMENIQYDSVFRDLPFNITDNYDLYYLEFDNWDADILDNANLVAKLLNDINAEKVGDEKNVIMGQSMGGLIARVALCQMEQGLSPFSGHDCRMYISHDAPHFGANFPLGAVYLAKEIRENISNGRLTPIGQAIAKKIINVGDLDPIVLFVRMADAISIRQMLYYYISNGSLYTNFYSQFQDYLDAIGFPAECENVTLVNGGRADYLYTGPHYSSDSIGGTFLLEGIIAEWEINPFLNANDLLAQASIKADGLIITPIKWLLNVVNVFWGGFLYDITIPNYYAPPKWPLDGLSQTSYGVFNIDSTYWHGPIAFIPTASALAYKKSSRQLTQYSDYTYSFYSEYLLPHFWERIPFDNAFLQEMATIHTEIPYILASWLGKVVNWSVSGPAAVRDSTTTYQMINEYGSSVENSRITWSVSNPQAQISNTGVLNPNGAIGLANICARYLTYDHKYIFKKKKVLLGIPEFTLQAYHYGGYKVKAVCDDPSEQEQLEEMLSDGVIQMHWGVKVGNSPIQWSFSPSASVQVTVPAEDKICDVFCNVWVTNSEEDFFPVALNIHFNASLPYNQNIEMLETTSYDISFYYTDYSSEYVLKNSSSSYSNTLLPQFKLHKNPSCSYSVEDAGYCRIYGMSQDCPFDPLYVYDNSGQIVDYYRTAALFNMPYFWDNFFDYTSNPPSATTENLVTVLILGEDSRPIQYCTFPIIRWMR